MKPIQIQQRLIANVSCALVICFVVGKAWGQGVDTDQINWGSLDGSTIVDSDGNQLAAANFTFALGAFATDFTPSETNVEDWFTNWYTFDNASYNAANGLFTGQYTMYDDPNGNFAGVDLGDFAGAAISRDAYFWIYNGEQPTVGTEWFLARAPLWKFPTLSAECCLNGLPLEWSMSDLSSHTPLWGNQLGTEGSGVVSNFNGSADLQTYTFIPEPSSAMLVAIAAIMGLLRRSRPRGVLDSAAPASCPQPPASSVSANVMLCRGAVPMAILCTAWLSFASVARSENIQWFCSVNAVNLDSEESPMSSGFVFKLGVFTPGFTPTESNLREWDDAWHPAQTATYRPSESRFNGVFQVVDNTAPFLPGANAWIMGTKVTPTGTEKILFRNSSWKWPRANRLNPLGKEWGVKQNASLEVVMGTVIEEGAPYLMQSAVLRDFEQWHKFKFAEAFSGDPNKDSDGDGVADILEFIFDTDPRNPNSRRGVTSKLLKDNEGRYLQLTIPRKRGHVAGLKVQVSTNLVDWYDGPEYTEVVEDTPMQLIVREKLPASADPGERRFMRLKVEP